MRFLHVTLTWMLLVSGGMTADADQSAIEESILQNRLNQLESQSIQRRGQDRRVQDLLNRQDDRLAGQKLNSLKTRDLRNRDVPRFERQLLRSRRPTGSFEHRR